MSEVYVLFDGYSKYDVENPSITKANCSCTFIKGPHNIIVDTMTSWDTAKLRNALENHEVTLDQINFVVSTHGHSDHIGNNNLFLNAKHIVGFSISFKDSYFLHNFDKDEEYIINDKVKIVPTPGHTLADVTVLVTNKLGQKIAITGDLFEKHEDIDNPNIWLEAGSDNPTKQKINRSKIANLADWIVPGHGSIFQVTHNIRLKLKMQAQNLTS